MPSDLSNLIPTELLPSLREDRFNISIKLQGLPYKTIWPKVRILLNSTTLIDTKVENEFKFEYQTTVETAQHYDLELILYNKLDKFTTVDTNGSITENMGVEIKSIVINDIDIVSNNLISNLGEFTPHLSKSKIEFFTKNNIFFGPSKTLGIFENGVWKMSFEAPIVSYLNKFSAFYEKHAIWPNNVLLQEIYDTINNIRDLESK